MRGYRPMRPVSFGLGRAAAASVVVDVGLAVASIFATRLLVHRLGAEPYGILGIVTLLSTQLVVLHIGVGPALTRLVAEARGRLDRDGVGSTLRVGFRVALVTAGAVALAFGVIAPLAWRSALKVTPTTLAVALSSVGAATALVAAQPLVTAAYAALTGEGRFLTLTVLRLVHGLSRLVVGVAVVLFDGGVRGVLLAQAAVDWTVVLLWRAQFERSRSGRSSEWPLVRRLIILGVPFSLAGVFAGLLSDGEKLGLGIARSVADFTYYSVPANAAVRFTLFGAGLTALLIPMLASVSAGGAGEEALRLARKATRIVVAVTGAALLPVAAVAPELLGLWLGPVFVERSTLATRIVLVGVLANASIYGAAAAVRARSHPGSLMLLYALELPVFVVLVLFCVRAFGIPGAALAWSVRVVLDACAQAVLSKRALRAHVVSLRANGAPLALMAAFVAVLSLLPDLPVALRALAGVFLAAVIALFVLDIDDWLAFRRLLPAGGKGTG